MLGYPKLFVLAFTNRCNTSKIFDKRNVRSIKWLIDIMLVLLLIQAVMCWMAY
jgi:hypothetical protein